MPDISDDVAEAIVDQLAERGAASVKVSDGQLFYFTVATLETLLVAARGSELGAACLFVVAPPQA
jgi:hypothetical protein